MNSSQIHRTIEIKVLAFITFLTSGFFTFLNLSEFVTVGLFQQTAGYPFGGESPAPWYYETPVLYAGVNLIFGLVFLLCFTLAAWASFKVKRKLLLMVFSVTILAILLQVINGAAQ